MLNREICIIKAVLSLLKNGHFFLKFSKIVKKSLPRTIRVKCSNNTCENFSYITHLALGQLEKKGRYGKHRLDSSKITCGFAKIYILIRLPPRSEGLTFPYRCIVYTLPHREYILPLFVYWGWGGGGGLCFNPSSPKFPSFSH